MVEWGRRCWVIPLTRSYNMRLAVRQTRQSRTSSRVASAWPSSISYGGKRQVCWTSEGCMGMDGVVSKGMDDFVKVEGMGRLSEVGNIFAKTICQATKRVTDQPSHPCWVSRLSYAQIYPALVIFRILHLDFSLSLYTHITIYGCFTNSKSQYSETG
jgi:hypothetical protein